jgi:hypothetical protein
MLQKQYRCSLPFCFSLPHLSSKSSRIPSFIALSLALLVSRALQYAKAKAAEEAAAEARAESSAGLATAGTVTYKLTAEGESRKAGQDIAITGFSIAVGGSVLLDNADLKLVQGKRYGL